MEPWAIEIIGNIATALIAGGAIWLVQEEKIKALVREQGREREIVRDGFARLELEIRGLKEQVAIQNGRVRSNESHIAALESRG